LGLIAVVEDLVDSRCLMREWKKERDGGDILEGECCVIIIIIIIPTVKALASQL
jgi:hypothetical protein